MGDCVRAEGIKGRSFPSRLGMQLSLTNKAAKAISPLIAVDVDPTHRRVLAQGLVGAAEGVSRFLVEQGGHAAVETVGGYRGGVDEPLGAGRRGRLEDVARAVQVHLAALATSSDDREREVNDDVGVLDQ